MIKHFLRNILRKKKPETENPGGENGKLPLEKGDYAAMIIAAVIVLGPYLLVFIGALLLFGWIFGAFR